MMATTFDDLNQFTWRGIAAPCRVFENRFSMAHAAHKRVDRDGARIETLGRDPYEFKVQILFLNGLTPAAQETWGADLFPRQYQAFIKATEDRSTGVFNHPVFGPINCKCIGWTDHIDPENRSGVVVDAVFLETLDTDTAIALGTVSAFSTASVAAGDLDAVASSGAFQNPFEDDSNDDNSFTGFVNSIQGIANTPDYLSSDINSKIAGTISTLGGLSSDFTGLGANVNVRVSESALRLSSSLRSIQQQSQVRAQPTSVYTVPKTTTLGALSGRLRNNIGDLISLNRDLLASPLVIEGARITYYS